MSGFTVPLLRRVADAVAGFRTTTPTTATLVIERNKATLPTVAVCKDDAQRDAAIQTMGGLENVIVLQDCELPTEAARPTWRVREVVVRYANADGEEAEVLLPGDEYDSLFWSSAAVEKFLSPHYATVYGEAFAAALETEYATQVWAGTVHQEDSKYTSLTGTPMRPGMLLVAAPPQFEEVPLELRLLQQLEIGL